MVHILTDNGDYMDVDVNDFLDSCSSSERKQLKRLLSSDRLSIINDFSISVPETIFEEHLGSIHGTWNRLTSEEEGQIMNIAKKFK
jgi:hypothetical protein